MTPRVKICGLTRLEDARYCAAAGADFLGFVMVEGSPRFVSPDLAKDLVSWVYGPKTVGVFANADPSFVNRVAAEVGFDLVQLHGDEGVELCREVEPPVIKAVPISGETSATDLIASVEEYAAVCRYVLLDTAVGGASGGTGQTFDWTIAQELAQSDRKLFVAGGLTPGNVRDVIDLIGPFGIDVSSGVEESPGVKSFEKITALMDAVAGAAGNGHTR